MREDPSVLNKQYLFSYSIKKRKKISASKNRESVKHVHTFMSYFSACKLVFSTHFDEAHRVLIQTVFCVKVQLIDLLINF